MNLFEQYFPGLSYEQIHKYSQLNILYKQWNSKINIISRKDIDFLNEKHIIHSLAIAKFHNFKSGTEVLDIGTGGGLPGIPLAILFPNVKFHLIDSIGKKIKVVNDISEKLGLKNIYEKLMPKGIVAIWSASANPTFTKRLKKTGFNVQEHIVRARPGKGSRHTIFVAQKD